MSATRLDFRSDPDAVADIPAVPVILDVVCKATGMGFAAVVRAAEGRFVACTVHDEIGSGIVSGCEVPFGPAAEARLRAGRMVLAVRNAPGEPDIDMPVLRGFKSCIAMPILLANGELFGVLCAFETRPVQFDKPQVTAMFRLFVELIGMHLISDDRLAASEASLSAERRSAELREQFIAVLGHDLRNPLAAIDAGIRLLQRTPLDERATRIVGQMQTSVRRMSGLINNVLDFARGRLGGGFIVTRTPVALAPVLAQVQAEAQATYEGRIIESDFSALGVVDCDAARIAQMLSNLLGNAITHGAQDSPVKVTARSTANQFELSVTNRGEPIPPETIPNLFKPFFRVAAGQQGLGLGLYIAQEIAKAHGGVLTAQSDAKETRFTFCMQQ